MGFFDKLKSVANAVTGGGANVTIEYQPSMVFPGDQVQVKVTATSTGGEIKSKGIFVDLRGMEQVHIKASEADYGDETQHNVNLSASSFDQEFQIAPNFVLGANETKEFEGTVQLPASAQPTFMGHYVKHLWEIRGRVEAFGNDPDSGFKPLKVGLKEF